MNVFGEALATFKGKEVLGPIPKGIHSPIKGGKGERWERLSHRTQFPIIPVSNDKSYKGGDRSFPDSKIPNHHSTSPPPLKFSASNKSCKM